MKNLYSPKDLFVLDNMKAFAILALVGYHSMSNSLFYIAQPFMMPIFAFVSGFANKENDCFGFTRKILVIFLFAHFCLPFATQLRFFEDMPTSFGGVFDLFFWNTRVGILWYLLALIVWCFVGKILTQTRYPFIYSVIISMIGTAMIVCHWDPYYYFLLISFKIFPLYMAGLLLSWKKIVNLRNMKYKILSYPALIFVLLLATKNITKKIPNILSIDGLLGFVTWQFLDIFLYLACIFVAIVSFPGRRIKYFTDIGGATLNVYICHMFFILIFNIFAYKIFGFDRALIENHGILETVKMPVIWVNLIYIYFATLFMSQPFFYTIINAPVNFIEKLIFKKN